MISRSKTLGHSMDFYFVEGDEIVYSDSKDYKFGDIIVYKCQKSEKLVCHRFFFRIGLYYIVAGDNNTYFEVINRSDLVGKGIMLIRTNRKRYNLERIDVCRNEYVKFIFKCVLIGTLGHKIPIFNKIYNKKIAIRNKLQVKYIEKCSL